ncbi:MAG: LysR family transcriptional regulator, partial [Anaerolineales bacterium]
QRIQALEKFIGNKLFNRTNKGISLTEAGEKLLLYCSGQRAAEANFLSNPSPHVRTKYLLPSTCQKVTPFPPKVPNVLVGIREGGRPQVPGSSTPGVG